jgi:hypothetical protein
LPPGAVDGGLALPLLGCGVLGAAGALGLALGVAAALLGATVAGALAAGGCQR